MFAFTSYVTAGEAQQAMLIGGMQPQPPQNSWLLNILAAQQTLHPNMLQMLPNPFAQQAFPQSNGFLQGQQPLAMANSAAMLAQQLQQPHKTGVDILLQQCSGRANINIRVSSSLMICFKY